MLGVRHKRAQHARGKLQLTLCDNLALTLALAKGHPHASTSHVVNCVKSAFSLISPSLSAGSHQSGTPQTVGRVCTDHHHVISFVTPEVKLCAVQKARTLRPKASALDHCSVRWTTLSGTGVLTKRRLVSGTPNPPRAQTQPKTTKRAYYKKNRSRRAEGRRMKFSAAADASHGLTFLQRLKVRAPTQHAIDSRVADFLQRSGEPSVHFVQWAQLDAFLAKYMDVLLWRGSWPARHRRHRQPFTTAFPRFQKLVMADCRLPAQSWLGSEQHRTGHLSHTFFLRDNRTGPAVTGGRQQGGEPQCEQSCLVCF